MNECDIHEMSQIHSASKYSCLENSMNRGAWQATVHGVAKSQTGLSDEYTHMVETRISFFFNVCKGFPCGSADKESACSAGDLGSIPGLGRYRGEGKVYPLQYSGLEKSMNCIVHGVTKSDRNGQLSLSGSLYYYTISSIFVDI